MPALHYTPQIVVMPILTNNMPTKYVNRREQTEIIRNQFANTEGSARASEARGPEFEAPVPARVGALADQFLFRRPAAVVPRVWNPPGNATVIGSALLQIHP